MPDKDCNCLKETAEKIKEYAAGKNTAPNYKVIEADWERRSLFPTSRIYANYIIKSTYSKKDGTTSKPINNTVAIFFTYCPFCGKKFPKV